MVEVGEEVECLLVVVAPALIEMKLVIEEYHQRQSRAWELEAEEVMIFVPWVSH